MKHQPTKPIFRLYRGSQLGRVLAVDREGVDAQLICVDRPKLMRLSPPMLRLLDRRSPIKHRHTLHFSHGNN